MNRSNILPHVRCSIVPLALTLACLSGGSWAAPIQSGTPRSATSAPLSPTRFTYEITKSEVPVASGSFMLTPSQPAELRRTRELHYVESAHCDGKGRTDIQTGRVVDGHTMRASQGNGADVFIFQANIRELLSMLPEGTAVCGDQLLTIHAPRVFAVSNAQSFVIEEGASVNIIESSSADGSSEYVWRVKREP